MGNRIQLSTGGPEKRHKYSLMIRVTVFLVWGKEFSRRSGCPGKWRVKYSPMLRVTVLLVWGKEFSRRSGSRGKIKLHIASWYESVMTIWGQVYSSSSAGSIFEIGCNHHPLVSLLGFLGLVALSLGPRIRPCPYYEFKTPDGFALTVIRPRKPLHYVEVRLSEVRT